MMGTEKPPLPGVSPSPPRPGKTMAKMSSMNCLSPLSFPLQRVTAAAAKLQLLWSENVISVGGAFNVLLLFK